MYWDVKKVKLINHLKLYVEFEDGLHGVIEFRPSYLTGVFQLLKDPDTFFKVGIKNGVVTWECGLDLAPDRSYHEIKNHGKWVLK